MHLGWAFISMAVLLCEEGYEHRHRCCVPRRNVTWRYTEEVDICKDGKRGPKLTVLVPWPRNSSKDPPWDVVSFVDLILVALENSHRVQTGRRALCWAGCVPGHASLWLTASGLSRLAAVRRAACMWQGDTFVKTNKFRRRGHRGCILANWETEAHPPTLFLFSVG